MNKKLARFVDDGQFMTVHRLRIKPVIRKRLAHKPKPKS